MKGYKMSGRIMVPRNDLDFIRKTVSHCIKVFLNAFLNQGIFIKNFLNFVPKFFIFNY